MFRKALVLGGLALAIGGGAVDLVAQSTGTPVFHAPYRAFQRIEFGGTISDPGSGLAAEGFYRFGQRRWDIGLRGGFHDGRGSDTRLLLGADFRTRVLDHSADFPFDGAFTVGVGGNFGDGRSVMFVPVGVSLGRRVQLEDSDIEFVPFVHPVLVPAFGGGDSDLLFGLGLGVDIAFNRRFELRVSAGIGDYDGVAVSFAFTR